MNAASFLRRSLLTLFLSVTVAGACAQAQPAKQEYEPRVGQEGKDVIWVPTPQALVDKMLDMAKVTANTTPTWLNCRSATLPKQA